MKRNICKNCGKKVDVFENLYVIQLSCSCGYMETKYQEDIPFGMSDNNDNYIDYLEEELLSYEEYITNMNYIKKVYGNKNY